MRTLVIGGSGSTGIPVLQGLLDRGHDVTMLHRGVHEPAELPEVRHLHADPHFAQTLAEAVGDAVLRRRAGDVRPGQGDR